MIDLHSLQLGCQIFNNNTLNTSVYRNWLIVCHTGLFTLLRVDIEQCNSQKKKKIEREFFEQSSYSFQSENFRTKGVPTGPASDLLFEAVAPICSLVHSTADTGSLILIESFISAIIYMFDIILDRIDMTKLHYCIRVPALSQWVHQKWEVQGSHL